MPCELVVDTRPAFVPRFTMVTVALETDAPLASVIKPVISAVGVWAQAVTVNRHEKTDKVLRRDIAYLPEPQRPMIVLQPLYDTFDGVTHLPKRRNHGQAK